LFLRNGRGPKTIKTETVYTKIFTPPRMTVSAPAMLWSNRETRS
jgi:hypothetical protein